MGFGAGPKVQFLPSDILNLKESEMDNTGVGFVVGAIISGILVGWIGHSCTKFTTAYDLCPTIFELSLTSADTLAMAQKHEVCWEHLDPKDS